MSAENYQYLLVARVTKLGKMIRLNPIVSI